MGARIFFSKYPPSRTNEVQSFLSCYLVPINKKEIKFFLEKQTICNFVINNSK